MREAMDEVGFFSRCLFCLPPLWGSSSARIDWCRCVIFASRLFTTSPSRPGQAPKPTFYFSCWLRKRAATSPVLSEPGAALTPLIDAQLAPTSSSSNSKRQQRPRWVATLCSTCSGLFAWTLSLAFPPTSVRPLPSSNVDHRKRDTEASNGPAHATQVSTED